MGAISIESSFITLHSDPVEKANILNNQFQSAFSEKSEFTKTDFQKRCNMTNTSYPKIQDLNITENGIAKLLYKCPEALHTVRLFVIIRIRCYDILNVLPVCPSYFPLLAFLTM
jgi:hypothetical protein